MTQTPDLTRVSPGHLLAPFGWAAGWLAAITESNLAFLNDLFRLEGARMHLIALALAHRDQAPSERDLHGLAEVLLRRSTEEICDTFLGRHPAGLKRALAHLPGQVLSREEYRALVELLNDPVSAKLLNHADEITGPTVNALHESPAELRGIIIEMDYPEVMVGLNKGLHFLASRVGQSYDSLVAEFAACRQLPQLIAKISRITDSLPLLETVPPRQIGLAHRLDRPSQIRAIAKRFRNCLAKYVSNVDRGECVLYLREHAKIPCVCLVERYGRLGWFLEQVKGIANAEIQDEQLLAIGLEFAAAGVPQAIVIQAVAVLLAEERRRPQRRTARDVALAENAPNDLAAAA
jgi:hypothetical protein